MFRKVQVVLACLVAECYALHHHQPIQAGYAGVGFAGYAAAPVPYGRYDAYASPPQPYSFGYDNVDEYGNRQFRTEQGDASNAKTGSYGYRDTNGLYRRVNYVADAYGFRAIVDTNEPGTAPGASADAVFNAAPVVTPVPTGAAQSVQGAAPYYGAGYGGYRGYRYNPNVGATAAYGYAPYSGQGYVVNAPALGGFAYAGRSPYGYAGSSYGTSYGPGVFGSPVGYESWPSNHLGYRRR